MKRIPLLAILILTLVTTAHAGGWVDLCGNTQVTPSITAFRNANFAIHIGAFVDENGIPTNLAQPRYEYLRPTKFSKTKWLQDQTGEKWTAIPGTDYTDLSPANRAAIIRAEKKWCAQIITTRLHIDCIMETPAGREGDSAALVEELAAAGFRIMANDGDPYAAHWTDSNAVTAIEKAWARINKAAAIVMIQVGIDFGQYNFSRMVLTMSVVNYYVSIDKSVIVGVMDVDGMNWQKAQQFFGAAIFQNPIVYKHYFTSYTHDVNAGRQIPGGKDVPTQPAQLPTGVNVDLTPRGPLYLPSDNWWNLSVVSAPVDPNSAKIVAFVKTIGNNGYLHPDFNKDFGISLTSVDPSTPLVPVTFDRYASESDKGAPGQAAGYPIPEAAKTNTAYFENHEPGGGSGDGHMLLFNGRYLYELAYCHWDGSKWIAGCGAVFDLNTNYRRPEGWTSTDAAGLAIAPGLIRADEVYGAGPISHAFRFSVHRTNGKVWPASHSGASDAGAPPLGFRIRLKAGFDIDAHLAKWPSISAADRAGVKKVLVAMKTYGAICADRGGSSVNFQGTQDARFVAAVWNPIFHAMHIDDFDVILLGWRTP